MLNFNSIEDLVSHMFEQIDDAEPVSVVANKDLAISIVQELLKYNNVILKYANVDDWDYDKEYIVTLHDDLDMDTWDVAIEPIYSHENEKYLGTDGYILFHEDVNSKVMIDMQNNENVELSGHDWFIIGEDDNDETNLDRTKNTDLFTKTYESYRVNGKKVDKNTYLKMANEIDYKIDNIFDDYDEDGFLDYFGFLKKNYKWSFCF